MALVAIGHFLFISGCEELTLSSATSQLIGSLRLLINLESSASPTLFVGLAGSMLGRFLYLSSPGRPYQHYFLQSSTCIAPFALACKIVHCLHILKPASPISAAYRFCGAIMNSSNFDIATNSIMGRFRTSSLLSLLK